MRHVGGPLDVLVGRIGAAPDEGHGQLFRVVLLLHGLFHLRDGSRQIGAVWTHQVRLQLRKIDLYHP